MSACWSRGRYQPISERLGHWGPIATSFTFFQASLTWNKVLQISPNLFKRSYVIGQWSSMTPRITSGFRFGSQHVDFAGFWKRCLFKMDIPAQYITKMSTLHSISKQISCIVQSYLHDLVSGRVSHTEVYHIIILLFLVLLVSRTSFTSYY